MLAIRGLTGAILEIEETPFRFAWLSFGDVEADGQGGLTTWLSRLCWCAFRRLGAMIPRASVTTISMSLADGVDFGLRRQIGSSLAKRGKTIVLLRRRAVGRGIEVVFEEPIFARANRAKQGAGTEPGWCRTAIAGSWMRWLSRLCYAWRVLPRARHCYQSGRSVAR